MAGEFIQLRGNLKLDLASQADPITFDVANWVSQFTINTTRESVAIPGTLGLSKYTEAGDRDDSLTVQFHSGVKAASLWAKLYAAISTPSSAIKFVGTHDPGPASVDNLEWSGQAILRSLATGPAAVSALRQQSLTLPIVAGTLATDDGEES